MTSEQLTGDSAGTAAVATGGAGNALTPAEIAAWEAQPRPADDGALLLNIDGYEGPIDLLLSLAKDQKVDLARISILQLADQYLSFVNEARRLRLEIAADYLVMAAWLAYLKSRLLLPDPPADDEPSGEEMAARLAYQLQRLEAIRRAAALLFALPQVGRDLFQRGAPEKIEQVETVVYDVSLFTLLKVYAEHRRKVDASTYTIDRNKLVTVEEALERLTRMLDLMQIPSWAELSRFLPDGAENDLVRRSALASTLIASLELAKQGRLHIRQERLFGPIYVRRAEPAPGRDAASGESGSFGPGDAAASPAGRET